MSEDSIQVAFVEWLENHPNYDFIKFSMIPNDTYTTSFNQKNRNKKMGLRAGLPDMFLVVNSKCFFIEFKTKIGVISQKQQKWHEVLNETNCPVYVCRSVEEACSIVNNLTNYKKLYII